MDPSRPVNATSGWLDTAGDVSVMYAIHTYGEVPQTPQAQAGPVSRTGPQRGGYTRTTDVESALNGLLAADREVEKLPAEVFSDMAKPPKP